MIYTKQQKKGKHVYIMLFLYWLILLIWQNIRTAANRDGIDTVIKAGLIVFLTIFFYFCSRNIKSNILIVFLFYLLVYSFSKLTASKFDLSDAMYYYFPLLMFLVTLGLGGNSTISKEELIRLCYMLIIAVVYIVIYAMIFQSAAYVQAITAHNAYGNELTSFLESSHEFGYYLAFAIMSAILCMDLDEKMNPAKKAGLIIAIILFSLSLILTFSRTAIVAFIVMLLWYVFSSGKRKLKQTLFGVIFAILIIIVVVKPLREYFLLVVFKDNNDAGRDDLATAGIEIFKRAPLGNMLFGYDRHAVQSYLVRWFRHTNFHNSFIQTLTCNGLIGVAFTIGCFIYEAVHIAKAKKYSPEWKKLSNMFFSFEAALMISMLFQTNSLFASSIDSYFLTFFGFLLPIYVDNAIMQNVFSEPQEVENDTVKN